MRWNGSMPVLRRYRERFGLGGEQRYWPGWLMKVIVTSYLFPGAKFDEDRLRRMAEQVEKKRLVVDVRCVARYSSFWDSLLTVVIRSCRKRDSRWIVAMNRWQDLTDMEVNAGTRTLSSTADITNEGLWPTEISRWIESLALLAEYSRWVLRADL